MLGVKDVKGNKALASNYMVEMSRDALNMKRRSALKEDASDLGGEKWQQRYKRECVCERGRAIGTR
jgi:hypothetical protein